MTHKKRRQAGTPALQITTEMLEAAERELRQYDSRVESERSAVIRILTAALSENGRKIIGI